MRNLYFTLAAVLVLASCTNNNTDGAAVGLKTGKDTTDYENTGHEDPNTGQKDPDMDKHEMYNYADSSTHKSE